MGTFVIGKLEAGTMYKGQQLLMMPNKVCSIGKVIVGQRVPFDISVTFDLLGGSGSTDGSAKRTRNYKRILWR